ncbi:MAG: sulfatase-like hydrolase/transferase [Kiritimatiellae bacterium]|nr:sulfatase-like hydrolase/transferase [Kiritimatiellia bacterium]
MAGYDKRQHPHILKFCSDEHTAAITGYGGDPWVRTPSLDRLAAGGVRFDRCYGNNPVCVPGRYSMLTGRLPREIGTPMFRDILPLESQTYMRYFAQHGYMTACVGKMHFHGPEQMYGWMLRPYGDMEVYDHSRMPGYGLGQDVTGQIGFGKTHDYNAYGGMMPFMIKTAGAGEHGFMQFDRLVTESARVHLRDHFEYLIHTRYAGARPLLFEVSFKTPHWPFICPKALFDYYRAIVPPPRLPVTEDLPPALARKAERESADCTEDQVLNARAAYYGLVEWMDRQIGLVLNVLDEMGLTDEFVIMYGADHGENAGERGMWGKSTFYDESVRVPMILAGPGLPAGRTVSAACSLIDVFPTLTDLAGLPPPQGIRGESLLPLLEDDTPVERTVFSELFGGQESFMAMRGGVKYVCYQDGSKQLFDLGGDPHETVNLAGTPEYAAIQKDLHTALQQLPAPWRNQHPDWRMQTVF